MKCLKTKYRIIKSYEVSIDAQTTKEIYKLQERFLWVFWITIFEYPTGLFSLEDVKSQIKRLKLKYDKKIVHEE